MFEEALARVSRRLGVLAAASARANYAMKGSPPPVQRGRSARAEGRSRFHEGWIRIEEARPRQGPVPASRNCVTPRPKEPRRYPSPGGQAAGNETANRRRLKLIAAPFHLFGGTPPAIRVDQHWGSEAAGSRELRRPDSFVGGSLWCQMSASCFLRTSRVSGVHLVNQAIWADAVRGVAPELATHASRRAAHGAKEYAAFIPEITALCATSRETAQAVAAVKAWSPRVPDHLRTRWRDHSAGRRPQRRPCIRIRNGNDQGKGAAADELVVPYLGKAVERRRASTQTRRLGCSRNHRTVGGS